MYDNVDQVIYVITKVYYNVVRCLVCLSVPTTVMRYIRSKQGLFTLDGRKVQ